MLANLLANLLSILLGGCTHRRMSFPITRNGKCSCSCLECGKEFAYDWQQMKVLTAKEVA